MPKASTADTPCWRGGIVRSAKRPLGWTPPGPTPAGPGDRDDLWPGPGEDLRHLAGRWRIFQRLDGHRTSLDDWATANFARLHANRPVHRALDLGCGVGSVLLMQAWLWPDAQLLGIEAQSISASLARRSVAYNGVEDRCDVIEGDIRDAALLEGHEPFDLVTGTPPYIPIGAGVISEKVQCEPCRFEVRGGIEAYCEAASRALAPGGRFVVCEGANPVTRTSDAARAAGLRIVAWQEVIGRTGKPPLFVLYAMEREAGAWDLPDPHAPLVVRDASADYTEEYLALRDAFGQPPLSGRGSGA